MRKPVAISLTLAVIFFIATAAAFPTNYVQAKGALEKLGDMLNFDTPDDDNDNDRENESITPVGTSSSPALVVLSHSYDDLSGGYIGELDGELLNSGSAEYDKFDIDISADFYDASHILVKNKVGYIDAQHLNPGDRTGFKIVTSDIDDAITYDLKINDERVVKGAYLDENDEPSNDNDDDDEDDD